MAALAESYPESMFEDDFDDSELGQSAISLHQSAMDVDQKQEERATTPTPATNSSKSTPRKKPRKIKILSPRKTPVKSTNMPTTPDARSRNDSEPAEEKLKVEEHDEEARDEEEQHSTPANPGQQIDQFDWDGLFNEFDKKMDEFGEDEEALYQEFDHLMKYFMIWQETATHHEVERSITRLQTRSLWVRNSEEGLENKRQHYLRVVDAFQNALKLLNA